MTDSAQTRLNQLERSAYQAAPPRSGGGFLWILVVSLSLNVFVIAFLVLQIQDGALWFEVESPQTAPSALTQSDSLKAEVIKLAERDNTDLIRLLDDETPVANGYRTQEFALALLHARGYQVEDPLRPLGAWPQPMSSFTWTDAHGSPQKIMLFSSVGAREFQAVKSFLLEASVPLTAQGILQRLMDGESIDSLRSALIRTDEWMTFSRMFGGLSESEALVLCRSLGLEGFSATVEWGRAHADTQELGPFLLAVFAKTPSSRLAEYLAAYYADTVVVQAPDETVLSLYTFLPPASEPGVRLAMRLLHGQRKLPVWQASQAYLARAAQMPALSSLSRDQVLEQLHNLVRSAKSTPPPKPVAIQAPPSSPVIQAKPPITVEQKPKVLVTPKPQTPTAAASSRAATRQLRPYRTYVVRKGDTLWSVSKRFNVDVEKLKYLNRLKGTALVPGKVLRIPH